MKIPTKETNIRKIILKTNDMNEMCMICRDETNTIIRCNYFVYEECINRWIEQGNNKCPYCRQEMKNELNMKNCLGSHFIETKNIRRIH